VVFDACDARQNTPGAEEKKQTAKKIAKQLADLVSKHPELCLKEIDSRLAASR
jgi:hypothetical protein